MYHHELEHTDTIGMFWSSLITGVMYRNMGHSSAEHTFRSLPAMFTVTVD
jgi:hypothetical protein